jgi:SPP1 family predicted phage head-tail adaptor
MRIGPLRHRVTIQSSTPVQDDHGEPIDAWANIATNPNIWADVQSAPAGEKFLSGAQQVQATVSHKVKIRYRTDVTVQMRLVEGSRYLYIENVVDPTGRTAELILMCREVQF